MHNTVALVTAGSAFEPSTARSASTSAAESKSTKHMLDSCSRRRPVVIATSRRNDRLSASVRRALARARPRSTLTRTHPPGDEYEGLLKHSPLFSHERLEKTSPLFAMLRNPPSLPSLGDGKLRTADSPLDTRNRLRLQLASDSVCQIFLIGIALFSQDEGAISTRRSPENSPIAP